MIVRRLLAGAVFAALLAPGVALAAAPASPVPAASHKPAPPKPKPAVTPSPFPEAPTPPPTAEQTVKARAEFNDFAAGRIDRTHYSGFANSQITDTLVTQLGGVLKSLGPVKSFVPLPTASYQGMTVYQFVATCANGSIDELIAWDGNGKVALIFFRQPK